MEKSKSKRNTAPRVVDTSELLRDFQRQMDKQAMVNQPNIVVLDKFQKKAAGEGKGETGAIVRVRVCVRV